MKTFVEVGSCYFNTLNELSDSGWRGVILEPVKKYLDKLEQKPNVQYINAAIDVKSGTREMRIASDELVLEDPDFAGMSSFINPNEVLSERILVNTITFEKMISFTGITQIDYLKLDTEGYDGFLILNYPFHIIKPKFIQFESKHKNVGLNDDAVQRLKDMGYYCEVDYDNTYCTLL